MSDRTDATAERGPADPSADDAPVVSCDRCSRSWDLAFELDELAAGNGAFEQFAMDHKRHTGHYPDDVTPWVARCRRCPAREVFLGERPARRWARVHARHTRHGVAVEHGSDVLDTVDGADGTNG